MILSAALRRVFGCALLLAFVQLESASALQLSESLDLSRLDTETVADDGAFIDEIGEPLPLALAETLVLPADDEAGRVIDAAIGMVGTPYRYGRDSDEAVDCSSLMRRVFRSVGQHLPRTAREMLGIGQAVASAEVRKGDLLFYRWQRRQLHVAVYVDDNTIIHASPKAGRVVVAELTPGWERRLVAVRRLI